MKVTIKEIAERAGRHRATVDKVLHNRVGVSDEVRMKVQRIIKEMGYTPILPAAYCKSRARSTASKRYWSRLTHCRSSRPVSSRAYTIRSALILKSPTPSANFRMPNGRRNLLITLSPQERTASSSARSIPSVFERRSTERWIPGIPVVATNADIDGTKRTCCVGINNRKAARIAGRLMGQFLGGTGKIAVVSSAIASENNNYYVQVRETEFADFIHKEYPDIEIITTLVQL